VPAIGALLTLPDELFVTGAYQALLGRSPDSEGLKNYVAQVREGHDKADILAAIASSPEGRAKSQDRPALSAEIARHRVRPPFWARLYHRLAGTALERMERRMRVIDNQLRLAEHRLADQEGQIDDLRSLVLEMLSNSDAGGAAPLGLEAADAAPRRRFSNISPGVARVFLELKQAMSGSADR
jgi:hypothetical protein